MDPSAPVEIGMAAGTDGEEANEEGFGKACDSPCRQCTRELEPKVDGVEERLPVGAYRSASTADIVQKAWSKTGGKKG